MKKRVGFTLIELLVVIAIIALPLSIIMPALRKVKAAAKKTVCSTNLKQNGQAFHLYAADNDDALFTGAVPNTHSAFYTWGGVTLDWEYGSYLSRLGYEKAARPYDRPMNTYLPTETTVYICPSDPVGDSKLFAPFGNIMGTQTRSDSTQAYYTSHGTSYQYNGYLVREDKLDYSKASEVKSAGNVILINDWPAYDVLGDSSPHQRPTWWTDLPRWSFHDNSGAGVDQNEHPYTSLTPGEDTFGNNTCFIDGHIEYIDYELDQSRGGGYVWYYD